MPIAADKKQKLTAEEERLEQARQRTKRWKRWGPYLSERAWGRVREDYSPHGTRNDRTLRHKTVSNCNGCQIGRLV